MPERIDYDAVAHLYDEPWRDHRPDPLLTELLDQVGPTTLRVLDIGCGTGKQIAANLHHHPQLFAVGLDRSVKMLEIAGRRCPFGRWVHGDGTSLPFARGTFDYVSCQFVHAHIPDKRTLVRESYRVLRPGGRCVQVNIDPWEMDWPLYRYFPAARDRDFADFVTRGELADHMRTAGFTNVQVGQTIGTEHVTLSAFLEFASSRSRVSQLSAISDADYAEGLERIARDISQFSGSHVVLSNSSIVTYVGDK